MNTRSCTAPPTRTWSTATAPTTASSRACSKTARAAAPTSSSKQEAQRLGRRLSFLTTVAKLWKETAIAWDASAWTRPAPRAVRRLAAAGPASAYASLLDLIEAVHRFLDPYRRAARTNRMSSTTAAEWSKTRCWSRSMATAVEIADAGRLLSAASGHNGVARNARTPADDCDRRSKCCGPCWPATRREGAQAWPEFIPWLAQQELLYVPLAKGGKPRRIVRARALAATDSRICWNGCRGWVWSAKRATCSTSPRRWRSEHPVGPGAVTEYDRLFTCGYQAIVRCLVDLGRRLGRPTRAPAEPRVDVRPSDQHARRRPAGPHRIAAPPLADTTAARCGSASSNGSPIRPTGSSSSRSSSATAAICSRRCFSTWAICGRSCTSGPAFGSRTWNRIPKRKTCGWSTSLAREISREDAARWLTIAIEAVVENYREYRDYNTTTTHSDHGEMLYTLVDFLRLRAKYDRVAWNLKPVVMAHEILVRQNRPAAAEMWQQALAERTAEAADANLARFEKLCDEYGIRLASIAERLAERFTRPLAIDRVRALVKPAMDAAGSERPHRVRRPGAGNRKPLPRAGRRRPRRSRLARRPGGGGLDGPLRPPPPRAERRRPAAHRTGPAQLGRAAAATGRRRGIGNLC